MHGICLGDAQERTQKNKKRGGLNHSVMCREEAQELRSPAFVRGGSFVMCATAATLLRLETTSNERSLNQLYSFREKNEVRPR